MFIGSICGDQLALPLLQLPTAGTKAGWTLPHTTPLIWQMLTYAHTQTKPLPYGKLSQRGWLQKTLSSILLKKCRKPGKPGWEEGALPICMSKVEDHFCLGREGQASQSIVTADRWDHRKSGTSRSYWVTPSLCLLPWRQETGACGKHAEKSRPPGWRYIHGASHVHTVYGQWPLMECRLRHQKR